MLKKNFELDLWASLTPWVSDMWLCTQLLHFAFLDAILKCELSSEYKSVDCPGTYKNCVHTKTQYPLVPEYTQATVLGLNSSRGVFTLVPTMYCTQARCPRMTKCELCLRNNIIIFTSSFSRYSKVSFNIIGTVQMKKRSSVQCNYHQRMKRLNWVSKLLLELISRYSLWSFLSI